MIFPTPMATAMTIRSMHNAIGGERIAKLKMKGLSIAFSAALVLRVVSQYAIGILWDWHVSIRHIPFCSPMLTKADLYVVLHLGQL